MVNAGDLHTGSVPTVTSFDIAHCTFPYRSWRKPRGLPAPAMTRPVSAPGSFTTRVCFPPVSHALCLRSSTGSSSLNREQLLLEAVHALVRGYGSPWKPRDKSIADAPGPVRSAYAMIEAQFKEELSVSDVAMAVEISPYHLDASVPTACGCPNARPADAAARNPWKAIATSRHARIRGGSRSGIC